MVRHRRDEDAIADAIRDTRRGQRDSQRPTGTEKALTTQVAAQAGSDAAAALGVAEQAASEALSAQTTADGKNAIFVGMTDPIADPEVPFAQGDLWYVTDVDGRMTMVKIWNGTSWAGYQFVADSIMVPGTVGATLISDGAVTTQKLSSEAIDGMTITGALIRTAPTGQRVQLDTAGLRTFDASNVETSKLAADAGGLALTGSLVTTEGGNAKRATLSDGGLMFDIPGSPGAASVSLGPSFLASGGDARMVISKDSGQAGSGLDLQAGVSPGSTAKISIDGNVPGGAILLDADSVKARGDTDWVIVMDAVGSSARAKYRRRDGMVQIRGVGGKGVTYYSCFTLPAGFRPGGELRFAHSTLGDALVNIVIPANGVVQISNNTATSVYFDYDFEPV